MEKAEYEEMKTSGRRWGLLFALFVAVATVLQLLYLRAAILYSEKDINYHQFASDGVEPSSVVNDGLVWITPKPDSAREVGWEDEWMMKWKRDRYSPDQQLLGCSTSYKTPYDDNLLCHLPGYIPARLYVPSTDKEDQPSIPRVIFISWFERRLGRAMYTSLLTLLHHNPEYEFILFNDEDVDHFICDLMTEDFAPTFSKVRAGAMRADIWRLLIIQRYGGVYLDSDISALNKLPIEWRDTAVSGVGCWTHLPSKTGGLLEHWAMAYMPRHPYVNAAVALMKENLENPSYLMKDNTPEAKAEDSVTMRLTGPAMYQLALHNILKEAKCEKDDNSYCPALLDPEKYCKDMGTFRTLFPMGLRLFNKVNLNNSVSHKIFDKSTPWDKETFDLRIDYDDVSVQLLEEPVQGFCGDRAFKKRARATERRWEKWVQQRRENP